MKVMKSECHKIPRDCLIIQVSKLILNHACMLQNPWICMLSLKLILSNYQLCIQQLQLNHNMDHKYTHICKSHQKCSRILLAIIVLDWILEFSMELRIFHHMCNTIPITAKCILIHLLCCNSFNYQGMKNIMYNRNYCK